ncbi:hypothetical protein HX881_15835 [Pseudomonas gingeri]|uniref:hypothetical protein n=1 Tax=Pseudomonas gingeri TaxID=117681 RepID=UPI0015A33550|nr:hypothetical protein [Pseudomonas gingeri]NVZ27024.1 hypothetical protein [Pseudomonas gingeri]
MNVGISISLAPRPLQGSGSSIQDTRRVYGPEPAGAEFEPLQMLAAATEEDSTGQRLAALSSAPGRAEHSGFRAMLSAPGGTGTGTVLGRQAPPSSREEKIEAFVASWKQASAVFNGMPRSSPLQDAQQAFERKFPHAPRPVDLHRIQVHVYQMTGSPPGDEMSEHTLVASPSLADLIVAHYNGSDVSTPYGRYPFPGILYYGHGDAYCLGDGSAHESPRRIWSVNTQDALGFIGKLPADKAREVAGQQARHFVTPGLDGKTPREALAEIRRDQILIEAQQQDDQDILSEEGKAFVESIVKTPSATDLEPACLDQSRRARVYSLSVREAAHDGNDNDCNPSLTLQGPFVMVRPANDQPSSGEDDGSLFVLYLPGWGLKEFRSRQDLMASIAVSPMFQRFLPEVVQARSPETTRYVFDKFEAIPSDMSFLEHSVQQQIDKQQRDTRHRLEQAGRRGVDLIEFDVMAGHSTRDFRKSFEPPRVMAGNSRPAVNHNLNVSTLLRASLRA